MKTNRETVIKIIDAIRGAFPDATIVFTNGACYGLYQILKSIFPQAEPYMTEDEEHILTDIDGRKYDIWGEFINLKGKQPRNLLKLTKLQMEYWDNVADGQRIEYMLKKYSKHC